MGCGKTLVKYILFFVNVVFMMAGLAFLGTGIAFQLQTKGLSAFTDSSFQLVAILTLVVGGVVFVIAFFGCCGAIKESNCLLVTYSMFMLVLMIAKLALATLVFLKLDDIIANIPTWMNAAFNENKLVFHEIEKGLECCGTTGPSSYVMLPESCCPQSAPTCIPFNSYSGCTFKLQDVFHTLGLAAGVIALVVVAFEVVAIVFGLCLATHVRNKNRMTKY